MKTEIVRNPDELQIITNPHPKKGETMAKQNKTDQALDEFKHQVKTAAYIIGGQAIAAQANAIVIPSVLSNQNDTVQQIARAGLPLTSGVLLAMFSKNKHIRGLSLGLGTQGLLEAIKYVMPDFAPSQGLAEGSNYVFMEDENGQNQQVQVTPQGTLLLPNGREVSMQEQAGKQNGDKESKKVDQPAGNSGDGLDDYYDSEYADVEYI
jgi:hypothetical protein